jgi:hypothetical protein
MDTLDNGSKSSREMQRIPDGVLVDFTDSWRISFSETGRGWAFGERKGTERGGMVPRKRFQRPKTRLALVQYDDKDGKDENDRRKDMIIYDMKRKKSDSFCCFDI